MHNKKFVRTGAGLANEGNFEDNSDAPLDGMVDCTADEWGGLSLETVPEPSSTVVTQPPGLQQARATV